jgi:hypothetical protein
MQDFTTWHFDFIFFLPIRILPPAVRTCHTVRVQGPPVIVKAAKAIEKQSAI